jgi:hypothetical protein
MSGVQLRAAATVVGLSIQEGVRKRVFLAVLLLTAAFLALYALGAHFAFRTSRASPPENRRSSTPTLSPAR